MTGRAHFVKYPSCIEDLRRLHLLTDRVPYVVVKVVTLPKIRYENFITDMAVEDSVEQHHLDEYHETDYEHGRTVHYHVVSTQEIVWFEDIYEWAGLKSFVMVQRTRQSKEVTSTETAYYISSLEADAKSFAQWIRGHWGIENTLHWVLDVQFHEDACKIHEGNAPENLSILRKMAKNLLGRAKTKADSFRSLQLRAGWDNYFLFLIIT